MDATFFASPPELRAWLSENHERHSELWIGFYKRSSGRSTITWPEAVDEALCVGWIDGVRKGIDDSRYTIRFTPRKPGSNWSAVNIDRVRELTRRGLMRPAGLRAFEERSEARSGIYSYEQRQSAELDAPQERQFRANDQAWEFFQSQPPSYQKAAVWWVITAKREETRSRRLAQLIADSAQGRTIQPLTRPTQRK